MIDGRHVSNVLDVRTFRDPNMDSDHYLVAGKVRMRISTSRAVPSSTQKKLPMTLVDYVPTFLSPYVLQLKLW